MNPKLNSKYPIEDFFEDMDQVSDSLRSNVFDFPKPIPAIGEAGRVEEQIRLNTKHPLHKISTHFIRKYPDEDTANARMWRFHLIQMFLAHNHAQLVKLGLIQRVPGGGAYFVSEFIEYLLRYRLNEGMVKIPKSAINKFLKSTH